MIFLDGVHIMHMDLFSLLFCFLLLFLIVLLFFLLLFLFSCVVIKYCVKLVLMHSIVGTMNSTAYAAPTITSIHLASIFVHDFLSLSLYIYF